MVALWWVNITSTSARIRASTEQKLMRSFVWAKTDRKKESAMMKFPQCYCRASKHIVICLLSSAGSVSSINRGKEKTDGGWARDDERKSVVFVDGQCLFVQTKLGRQCNSQLPWLQQILSVTSVQWYGGWCAATQGPIISRWLSVRSTWIFWLETIGCNCADYKDVGGIGTREDEEGAAVAAAACQWTACQMSGLLFRGVWCKISIFPKLRASELLWHCVKSGAAHSNSTSGLRIFQSWTQTHNHSLCVLFLTLDVLYVH